MIRQALVVAALGACSTPDLKISFAVADGTFGPACGATDCGDVPMACEAVLHLRVLRPSDPTAPFISICTEVRPNSTRDLCAIGQVDLPATQLPREVLEVQITVWPRDAVLDLETGQLDCGKVPVEFDATMGFPIPVAGTELRNPAFGGRAFYQPGDAETVVTLGCVDPSSINASSCAGGNSIQITSTIGDFENLPFSVSPTVGDRLDVGIGEPVPFDEGFPSHRLSGTALHNLERTVSGPTPVWGGGIDEVFMGSACIQVREDVGQATSVLRCQGVSSFDTELDLPGVRLPKATLDQVLAALQMSTFPAEGLTIGIVLDHVGNPSSGKAISTTGGTIEYLDAARSALVAGQTSASGMFVSRDAPYGTIFTTSQINQTPISAMGGRVDEKVTVVVLQFDMPPIGG